MFVLAKLWRSDFKYSVGVSATSHYFYNENVQYFVCHFQRKALQRSLRSFYFIFYNIEAVLASWNVLLQNSLI